MEHTNGRGPTWHGLLASLLIASYLMTYAANAHDDALEREQLTTLARQIELIDRLAEHTTDSAPEARTRYHFDYTRLRDDLRRVRIGIQDYLVPRRAQPRDPAAIDGNYTQRDDRNERQP